MNRVKTLFERFMHLLGQFLSLALVVCWISFIVAMPLGYFMGIYKLACCDFKEPYKAEILYLVGIPTGLNCVSV